MSEPPVLPFRLPRSRALEIVRKLAKDTRNVIWSDHCLDRMLERDIPHQVALRILRTGDPDGEVSPGSHRGEWKLKLIGTVKGRREAGVIVLIIQERRLFVKTVEWEDL